ncbi:MAG: tRNA pseudouridine(38-40) synthase TruA [Chitinophagaceae bacterium]|nr:tRNA pseudouridine(38-40) synthase TruA [Chitinophagaceae bacterium]
MIRYFLEVAYLGTHYAGFQVQPNAITIQSEIEKAFGVFFRKPVSLTGSSRTDTGVHARQNFFHFDWEEEINPAVVYNLNALLPGSIVIRQLIVMPPEAHSRFDATSREYRYYIALRKDPFLQDRSYFYPFTLDKEKLQAAAAKVKEYEDFTSFSKKGSQAKTMQCRILQSDWEEEEGCLVYKVEANRFLRGMVRGLTGTMLQVGRGKLSVADFEGIIRLKDATRADFSVPGQGLFLQKVNYPAGYFPE